MTNNKIDSLTSLRFFAALSVFFYHFEIIYFTSAFEDKISDTYRFFIYGNIGVTFFFVLSGFIISYSYNNHKNRGGFNNYDFILFRAFRIYPLHILTLLISASLLYIFDMNLDIYHFLSNMFLVQSLIPDLSYYFSYNAVSWSLSCEIVFYIIFCFISFLNRSSVLLITLTLLSLILLLMYRDVPVSVSEEWVFYINPFFRVLPFLFGVILYKYSSGSQVIHSKLKCTAFEILSIITLAISIYISSSYDLNGNLKREIIYIPAMLFIVYSFSLNNGVISKVLCNKYMVFLGEASFSMYMIHVIVIQLTGMIPNIMTYGYFTYMALTISIIFILSSLIYLLYEKKTNHFLRAWWKSVRNH